MVKFQRGGVVLKVVVLPRLDALFFAVCMQTMKHSVANVPRQQAVKLEVVGPRFIEKCCFELYLEDQ